MYKIDIDGLERLMSKGQEGVKYAWEHYDELAARQHLYELYGAIEQPLGACIPSNLVQEQRDG